MKNLITILMLCFLIITDNYPQQYGWQVVYQPPVGGIISIDFIDSLYGCAFNNQEGMLRTTDGGLTWRNSSTIFRAAMWNIDLINHKNGWAFGDNNSNNAIYKTNDSGKTWSPVYFADNQSMPSGQAINLNKVIGVGRKHFNGPPFPVPPDTAIIVKSTDGGNNFIVENYTEEPKLAFRKVFFSDTLHGWMYGEYEDINSALHGAFLKTNDGGKNWTRHNIDYPIGDFNFLRFGVFTFIDSLRGYGWGYGFRKTNDGGITWDSIYARPFPDPIDPGFNDIKFIDSLNGWSFGGGVYNGTLSEVIYKTTDGGYNWELESIGLSSRIYQGIMLSEKLGYAAADEVILKHDLITRH